MAVEITIKGDEAEEILAVIKGMFVSGEEEKKLHTRVRDQVSVLGVTSGRFIDKPPSEDEKLWKKLNAMSYEELCDYINEEMHIKDSNDLIDIGVFDRLLVEKA